MIILNLIKKLNFKILILRVEKKKLFCRLKRIRLCLIGKINNRLDRPICLIIKTHRIDFLELKYKIIQLNEQNFCALVKLKVEISIFLILQITKSLLKKIQA